MTVYGGWQYVEMLLNIEFLFTDFYGGRGGERWWWAKYGRALYVSLCDCVSTPRPLQSFLQVALFLIAKHGASLQSALTSSIVQINFELKLYLLSLLLLRSRIPSLINCVVLL
jgi:hypothetical protein